MSERILAGEFDGAQEHDVPEFRVCGPPGVGKTTWLARQVRRAAEKYGPDKVLVTSFSTTAAKEVAGRDLVIPKKQVGTLHSHCYQALDRPTIAETKVGDWNKDHPAWKLSSKSVAEVEEGALEGSSDQENTGDALMQQINRFRSKMVPVEAWPPNLQGFWEQWTEWKRGNSLMDFTDLLETAYRDIRIAPGDPRVIMGDEGQDFSKLQTAIIRQWGRYCDYFLLIGDIQQCIFNFTGASPEALLYPELPPDRWATLKQSYRVPRAVHEAATQWIAPVELKMPNEEYFPRDADGLVRRVNDAHWSFPATVINDIEAKLAEGKSCMILASCSYMLAPTISMLRARGLPFCNPYRPSRGDWNPLAGTGNTAAVRLAGLLAPHDRMGDSARLWTVGDLKLFTEWSFSKGLLRRGAKTEMAGFDQQAAATADLLEQWFEEDALTDLMSLLEQPNTGPLIQWWQDKTKPDKRGSVDYAAAIAQARGPWALREEPKVMVGTIHSVKGGQADVVYVIPDLSIAGLTQWKGSAPEKDSVRRLFYVAMTRAREELVFVGPKPGGCAVQL